MKCDCGRRMRVVDSRTTINGGTRRCRYCSVCDKRVQTLEVAEKAYSELSSKDRLAKVVINNLTMFVNDLKAALESAGRLS